MKKHEVVYVPVSVEERLPDEHLSGISFAVKKDNNTGIHLETWNGEKFVVRKHSFPITHWLEEQKDKFVLSEEELNLLFNVFLTNYYHTVSNIEDKEYIKHFLQSKLKP